MAAPAAKDKSAAEAEAQRKAIIDENRAFAAPDLPLTAVSTQGARVVQVEPSAAWSFKPAGLPPASVAASERLTDKLIPLTSPFVMTASRSRRNAIRADQVFALDATKGTLHAQIVWVSQAEGYLLRMLQRLDLITGRPVRAPTPVFMDTQVLDVSPDGSRVLLHHAPAANLQRGQLHVCEITEGGKPLKPLASFTAGEFNAQQATGFALAAFTDNNLVVTFGGPGGGAGPAEMVAWNVSEGSVKPEYVVRIDRGRPPVISADRRTLVVASADASCLLEAASGKVLGRLEGPPAWLPTFATSGKRLAEISADAQRMRVWNLATGKQLHDVQVQPGVPARTRIHALDEETALLANGDVLDLASGLAAWEYRAGKDRKVAPAWGPELLLRQSLLLSSEAKTDRTFQLGLFKVPHAAARERAAGLRPFGTVPLMSPGSAVQLELAIDGGPPDIVKPGRRLSEQLQRAGVIPTEQPQLLKVTIQSTPGEVKEVKLQTLKNGKAVPLETIKSRPVIHWVGITLNEKVLWEQSQEYKGGGAGSKKGKSRQESEDEARAESYRQFVDTITLPNNVRPSRDMLPPGKSLVSSGGVIDDPVAPLPPPPTSPPATPAAAPSAAPAKPVPAPTGDGL